MLDKVIIKIKYDNNNVIDVIKDIKKKHIPSPKYVYNINNNIFKIELYNIKHKQQYVKHFKVLEDKLYKYKIILNNFNLKNYEIEEAIKLHTHINVTAIKVFHQEIDTGVVLINSPRKIKKGKRLIKIKNKTYRIICREDKADSTTLWRVVPANSDKKQWLTADEHYKIKRKEAAHQLDSHDAKHMSDNDKGKGKEKAGSTTANKMKMKADKDSLKKEKEKVADTAAKNENKVIIDSRAKNENKATIDSDSSESSSSDQDTEDTDSSDQLPLRPKRIPNISQKNSKDVHRLLQEKSFKKTKAVAASNTT